VQTCRGGLQPPGKGKCTTLANTRTLGAVIATAPASDAAACCQLCTNDGTCVGFNLLADAACETLRTQGGSVQTPGCTAGFPETGFPDEPGAGVEGEAAAVGYRGGGGGGGDSDAVSARARARARADMPHGGYSPLMRQK
jgi:hypothetical protein